MKILVFTSLYPNAETPGRGVFVETRLRKLIADGRVEARVIAPVPWFPWSHPRFGRFATFARVPRHETRFSLDVRHPRYLSVPLIGTIVTPLAMAIAARGAARQAIRDGFAFDAIDAHYFFPDGVAAALLAGWFGRPLVITARGTDINWFSQLALPRRMILWAARRAAAVVTVCRALKNTLVELGADGTKIKVLRNGVDLAAFAPLPMDEARGRLATRLGRPVLAEGTTHVAASVGNLIPLKGHDLVIEALTRLPQVTLAIAGSGPEHAALVALATRLGVIDRVRFLGQLWQEELRDVYAAADALVLASSREGWANVLLEAMACGTPVIASDVGGSNEVVTAPEAGILLTARTSIAIADALRTLFGAPTDRNATRRYAERFSWDETTVGQQRLFESICVARPHTRLAVAACAADGDVP